MIKKIKEFLLENRGLRQTVAKNIFWLSVSQLGSRLIRAVIIIYAARILGAAEYGLFSYILSFTAFFTIFADLGVSPLLTRDIANQPEERHRYFATSFWIKILLLLFTTLIVIFVAPHFTNIKEAVALIPLVSVFVFFDSLRDFIIAYFRGLEKMEWEALVIVAMNVAIVATGFISLSISRTAEAFLFSYIASVVFATLLAAFIIRKQFMNIVRDFDKNLARKVFHFAWPIAFSGILGVFMLNTDTVMLGWWRNATEIGYYSAGQRIIQVLYTLPVLFSSSIFPVLSRFIGQKDEERTRRLTERAMAIVLLAALPIVLGGIVLAQPIIKLIFGNEYLPATSSFQILLATLILVFPGAIVTNLVLARNQQRKMVGYVAVGSVGNIIFNTLLIPSYGIVGSSIATWVAQFLYYGLTWYGMKKISDFQTLKHLKKMLLAAAIMGASTFSFNQFGVNIVVNIVISAGIYLGVLRLLKEEVLGEAGAIWRTMRT